jgi:hypothetical protein
MAARRAGESKRRNSTSIIGNPWKTSSGHISKKPKARKLKYPPAGPAHKKLDRGFQRVYIHRWLFSILSARPFGAVRLILEIVRMKNH